MKFSTVLFDWGDTVMHDDPASTLPMVEWTRVEAVQGIEAVLEYLQSSGRRAVLATSAAISDEAQIWGALARVNLEKYFSRIYCFKNTNIPKSKAFYRLILKDLGVDASEVLMVGDTFEKDVLAANQAGIFAVWFNPRSGENPTEDLHATVHSTGELLSFFQSVD